MARVPEKVSGSAAEPPTAPAARLRRSLPRLHVITNDDVLAAVDFTDRARSLIAAHGARIALHVRAPAATGAFLFERTRPLVSAAREAGTMLLVNDRVDVAMVSGADGAQLARRSIPVAAARTLLGDACVIGASVHDSTEVRAAEGADFLVFGTVHDSDSHPGRPGAGLHALGAAAAAVSVPVVAIGGIDAERIPAIRATGAYGAAVVRAVWHAQDVITAAGTLIEALEAPAPPGP